MQLYMYTCHKSHVMFLINYSILTNMQVKLLTNLMHEI